MLALEPSAVDWTVAELELFDGATTDQFYGSTASMVLPDVMDELVAWADLAFAPTFSWSWARDATTGGAIATLSATGGTFTLEATNSAAQTGYGLNAGVKAAAASHTFDNAAAATWAPSGKMMASAYLRVLASGDSASAGAIRPGSPGVAHRRPVVAAVGTAIDAARMAATLAAAASPRRATVWQVHTSTWVPFALGEVARNAVGTTHYRFELQASGDVI